MCQKSKKWDRSLAWLSRDLSLQLRWKKKKCMVTGSEVGQHGRIAEMLFSIVGIKFVSPKIN